MNYPRFLISSIKATFQIEKEVRERCIICESFVPDKVNKLENSDIQN